MKFSEAIQLFGKHKTLEIKGSTYVGYARTLAHFGIFLRNPLITHIRVEDVIDYLNYIKTFDNWHGNNFHRFYILLTSFLRFWLDRGYPVLNPDIVPYLPKCYVEPRVAKEDDFKKLCEVWQTGKKYTEKPRNLAIALLLRDTGIRIGEALSSLCDIDTDAYEEVDGAKQYSYIIRTEKVRENLKNPKRRIFWYEETNKAIKVWLSDYHELMKRRLERDLTPKDPLFPAIRHSFPATLTNTGVNEFFYKGSKEAGLSATLNPHSLRHLFGNTLAASGANNSIISDLMGHADLASSRIYTHLNDEQQKKAHVKYLKR